MPTIFIVTSPELVPIIAWFPFNVSFPIKDSVVPPMFPLIGVTVSITASIVFATLTSAAPVLQFAGFAFFSQIS
ncbi:hypothetical protein D3C85_161510 [compost metagenome]